MKNDRTRAIKSFTDLTVWQESHKLVIGIYQTTSKFPLKETYTLVDQMRRSAISLTSNIAEGFGRNTYKDKINFYYLAQGSLSELKNQLIIAHDVSYLGNEEYKSLYQQANIAHQLLYGLIRKSKSFIPHSS